MNDLPSPTPQSLDTLGIHSPKKKNKNVILITSFVSLLIFAVAIIYLGFRLLYNDVSPVHETSVPDLQIQETQEALYFTTLFSTIGTYDNWVLSILQPDISSIVEENNSYYLIGSLPDGEEIYNIKFFLTGVLDNNLNISTVNYTDVAGNSYTLTGSELLEKVKDTNRVSITYITRVPSDYISSEVCSADQVICGLSRWSEDESIEQITRDNINEYVIESNRVLPIYSLSEILVYE